MSFLRDAPHQVRPALGVTSEDEESGPHPLAFQRVKNLGRRVRVRPVVKGKRDDLLIRRKLSERAAEHGTVSLKGAVRCHTERERADDEGNDHSRAVGWPSTAA